MKIITAGVSILFLTYGAEFVRCKKALNPQELFLAVKISINDLFPVQLPKRIQRAIAPGD